MIFKNHPLSPFWATWYEAGRKNPTPEENPSTEGKEEGKEERGVQEDGNWFVFIGWTEINIIIYIIINFRLFKIRRKI